MSGVEFDRRADVEHGHVAGLEAGVELPPGDGFQAGAVADVGFGEFVDPLDVVDGDVAQRRPQITDPVRGEGVDDPVAVTSGA